MTELAQLQASAEQAAALLKAMSHPKRLLILCMLSGSPGTSAGELTRITGLSASATSQHLARMGAKGLSTANGMPNAFYIPLKMRR